MSFVMAYFCEALYLIRCSNPTVYMVPFIWPQNPHKKEKKKVFGMCSYGLSISLFHRGKTSSSSVVKETETQVRHCPDVIEKEESVICLPSASNTELGTRATDDPLWYSCFYPVPNKVAGLLPGWRRYEFGDAALQTLVVASGHLRYCSLPMVPSVESDTNNHVQPH